MSYIKENIDFVLKDSQCKRFLLIALAGSLLQFIAFKILYPYANFMPDSYAYIEAADVNAEINMWPIGYSKFLRFYSAFSHSDTLLVLLQYFLLQVSGLYFFFTIRYFFRPGNFISYILLFFITLNPVFLYLSNYISADAIFTALSLCWLSQLFWIVFRRSPYLIFTHAMVLFFLYALRYNALYYPLISLIAFVLSKITIRTKLFGMALSLGLISFSIFNTRINYREMTGTNQFSAFGGWQLASNALFMYKYVANDNENVPSKFNAIHKIVLHHLDSLQHLKKRPDSTLGIYYLWKGPLVQYACEFSEKDSTSSFFKKWASIAPLYHDYGSYLIKNHPSDFINYFILPNTINYLKPPIEFLGVYNMQTDSIRPIAIKWFHYDNNRLKHYFKDLKVDILNYYPLLITISHLSFLFGFVGFIMFGGFRRQDTNLKKALILVAGLWVGNLTFSILASPIVLRYQLFSMVVNFAFALVIFEYIILLKTEIHKI